MEKEADCANRKSHFILQTCKYVHYELDPTPDAPPHLNVPPALGAPPNAKKGAEYCSPEELGEPQWINCDIRTFNYPILGKVCKHLDVYFSLSGMVSGHWDVQSLILGEILGHLDLYS
jgi:hypothetical protein